MDGVDAALVDVKTHELKQGITCSYSDETRQCLDARAACDGLLMRDVGALNTMIGREFAQAVESLLKSANCPREAVAAIGSHGQTLCHDANGIFPYTLQVGCAHTISSLTGFTVVSDFRTRDMIHGGQGAPLAPVYHQAAFQKRNTRPFAVVNLGGIANLSVLLPGAPVIGFDTGPGNCLMDLWTQKHRHRAFDAGGAWAATGVVNEGLLSKMLTDPFFNQRPPKSIGKEYFSEDWLAKYVSPVYSAEEIQATLNVLTAESISQCLLSQPVKIEQVFICGGGVHNQTLMRQLRNRLPERQVCSTQTIGISPDYLEAMMFAWLAEKTLSRTRIDLSSITGATQAAILGAVYYGERDAQT